MIELLIALLGLCGLVVWAGLLRAIMRGPQPPLFAKLILFLLGGLMIFISGSALFG